MTEPRFCILGAGVVGLTTGLELLQAFPASEVTVVAEKYTVDTTSHGAAGIFRPGLSFAGPSEEITLKWISDSYKFYFPLLKEPKSGVHMISGFQFSNISHDLTRNKAIEHLVPVYRDAKPDELTVEGKTYKFGSYYETLVTENCDFLLWAMRRLHVAGAKFRRCKVSSFQELEEDFDVVFNCSGMDAKYLCADKDLVPVRGQVMKVFAPWLSHFYYLDYDVYIIPHSNGTATLGGCRHLDSYSTDLNRHDSAAIQERCHSLLPRLSEAPLLYEWGGLRPHRSSVRVQVERIGRLQVIHNYGHGGYGVTTAPGTAKYAVELYQELLNNITVKSKL